MNYDPFIELQPPKSIIKYCIKAFNIEAGKLLQDIRELRQNPLADWLVEEKLSTHKQLINKIKFYSLYLKGKTTDNWELQKSQAKSRPITDFYLNGKKRGNKVIGPCPFHDDSSPSFVIYLDQNTWWCFGACGLGGDVIDYIMKTHKFSFQEAIKLLSK